MGMEKPNRKSNLGLGPAAAAATLLAGAYATIPKNPDKPQFPTEQSQSIAPHIEAPIEQKQGLSEHDFDWLALNIYHEARGEEVRGKLAVAQVTLARINKHNPTIEHAVIEPLQFSWTNDKKILDAPVDEDQLAGIRMVLRTIIGKRNVGEALSALSNITGLPMDTRYYKSTSYNENDPDEKRMSKKAKAHWKSLTSIAIIGSHGFYIDKKHRPHAIAVKTASNKPRS